MQLVHNTLDEVCMAIRWGEHEFEPVHLHRMISDLKKGLYKKLAIMIGHLMALKWFST